MTPLPVLVLGSINMDIVMQVESLPTPGETTLVKAIATHPGGKGANQAVAAARMGAAVSMIGAVGSDAYGDEMLGVLKAEGIDVSAVARRADQPTGTAHIAVDAKGENMILVAGGANRDVALGGLARASVRIAQLETPIDDVAAFLRGGSLTILNAAPFVAEARALFDECDIVIVNEVELAGYAGAEGDVVTLARTLLAWPDQTIVVTLGGKGAVAVSAENIIEVTGMKVAVVDTVGAGDCFCGVLAAGLAAHMPLEAAMQRANRAASIAVGRVGAIPSLPHAEELA